MWDSSIGRLAIIQERRTSCTAVFFYLINCFIHRVQPKAMAVVLHSCDMLPVFILDHGPRFVNL